MPYDDDNDLPGATPKRHSRGTTRSWLTGLLAARGVVLGAGDKVKSAVLEETLDRAFAYSSDGEHLVVLHDGYPVRAPTLNAAMESLANQLAVRLGGSEAAVPRSFEEVKEAQRRRDPTLYSF